MPKFIARINQILIQLPVTTIIGVSVLYYAPMVVASAPTPPSQPESPSAPEAPEEPEAPESPSAPEAPTAPTAPTSDSTDEADVQEPVTENPTEENTDSNPESTDQTSDSSQSSTDSETQTQTDTQTAQSSSDPETTSTDSSTSSDSVTDPLIETGDATTNLELVNDINTNASATSPSGPGEIDLSNQGNGTDSDNTNTVDLTSDTLTLQDNDATVVNNAVAGSETGDNDNSDNTGGDTTTNTGDANTTATIITSANTNAAGVSANEFNVVDDYTGDIVLDASSPCQSGCQAGEVIILDNAGNGSDSQNSNQVDAVTTDTTFQNNNADVDNNVFLSAESGDNESDDNTGGNTSITTGDANIAANVVSFLNNNIAGQVVLNTVNIFGDLIGDIIAPNMAGSDLACSTCATGNISMDNAGNGSDSQNQNSFNTADSSLLIQDNNAVIGNNVEVAANTGDNQSSDNTGGNTSITTGESNVDVNVLNVANQNVSGGDWWIVLVNQAGNWIGQILGSPTGSTMAGSAGTQFQLNPDGSISIVNDGNGSGSTNTNQVSQTSDSLLSQTNTANLTNNLSLDANTGNNHASGNTGGNTSITTGDTNVIANLVNFVNNNFAGNANVMLTIVNVFGSWNGNFVSPDQATANSSTPTESLAIGGLGSPQESNDQNQNSDAQVTSSDSSQESQDSTTEAMVSSNQPVDNPTLISYTPESIRGATQALHQSLEQSNLIETPEQVLSQSDEKVKVKVSWTALLTTLAGLAYAAIRARSSLLA